MSKRKLYKPNPEIRRFAETIDELPRACSDEAAAVEFIEKQRWGDTPACPHCGGSNVYKMVDAKTGERSKRFLWRCHGCKKQFTVRIGTVFEDSRIPLRHWCYGFWRAATSKKGVAALEIMRQTGLSYKSSLFLLHRIRFAMSSDSPPKLSGTVEVDEAYIGGTARNRHDRGSGRGTQKVPVVGLLQRGGQVRCRPVANVTSATLRRVITEHVEQTSRLMTDDFFGYRLIGREYADHQVVRHGLGEYARGDATTNGIEGFFSLIKRGMNGIYHKVSKQYLPLYLNEFEFRYNRREMNDGDRITAAIRAADGKRLMYRDPRAKS